MEHVRNQILMLPSPGMGHIIPLVELAKLLHSRHGFSTTFLIPTIGDPPQAQTSFLEALPGNINYILLPQVDFSDLPSDAKMETKIILAVTRSIPSIREVLSSLTTSGTRPTALVMDQFAMDGINVAAEFGVPPYLAFLPNATVLSYLLHLPELDRRITCEYRDYPDPITLPRCVPVPGKDLPDPFQNRKDESYKRVLQWSSVAKLANGILVNTYNDLEPGPLQFLLEQEPGMPPVYPIGPIIQSSNEHDADQSQSECLRWLDDQPDWSVLYVSFGSGGTLSSNQINELAFGLELSEQRFLWVVRSPNDKSSSATYFSARSKDDSFGFLPQGFVERTQGRGLLVPSWAPQIKVLSHRATGGFLTHCGWNSSLEAIAHGVPMIAWPLYAEQKTNAVMLSEQTEVALRPRADESGFVRREEVARVVKELMEGNGGKRIRGRVRELSIAAKNALSDDGTSTKALNQLVACKSPGPYKAPKLGSFRQPPVEEM